VRIAFYAPMKPSGHAVPSGDRRVAGLLLQALRRAGHEPLVASRMVGRDSLGDPSRQERLQRLGARLGRALIERWRDPGVRPDLWFTYHLYYKAPDWIGPGVARALEIPYVVAEASVAPKRAEGPWARGHAATLQALEQAAAVIALNPADLECLPPGGRRYLLAPFLDAAPYARAARKRACHRESLARRYRLETASPWILAVAMMREGDKLDSYRLLATALGRIESLDWRLLVVGDGPARGEVEAALARFGRQRVRFLGTQPQSELSGIYAAADLLAWPAVREAYGMALLEAQASGLPVVAGQEGGVASIVAAGTTGLLTAARDETAFAEALTQLLRDPARRLAMSENARHKVACDHDLPTAARRLDEILRPLAAKP
jgi:glycosyltransferase involved in cell wall biosynthesis